MNSTPYKFENMRQKNHKENYDPFGEDEAEDKENNAYSQNQIQRSYLKNEVPVKWRKYVKV